MPVLSRRADAFVVSLILCFSSAAVSCATAVGEEEAAAEAQPAALSFDPASLSGGTRRTLVDGIQAAENQWFTSTGRLLISGDEGIFEVVAAGGGAYKVNSVHAGESCQFGGLTELQGTLYANCYDSTNSSLFAAKLADTLDFRAIYALPGTALANGLTNDGRDHLIVASTFDSTVIQLQLSASDPLVIEGREVLDDNCLTVNGVKYFGGKLYWSGLFNVSAGAVTAGKLVGNKALYSAVTFFDDLYVDSAGIVVADYLAGSIVATDLTGVRKAATVDGTFDGPSSVQPSEGRLGLPRGTLVVTERSGNRVSLLSP